MRQTTRHVLQQERQDAPLVLTNSVESLNTTSCLDSSKHLSHSRSGYNARKSGRISPNHNVFVRGVDGKPLTPTTNAKARKLMEGNQAKPIWNKFSKFGIQMLVETRKETPKTALGVDFGTKFEGYAVMTGKENNLSVMWKLPDKKKLVKKLEERRILRRARRWRNCRRRECRSDNREKIGFLAPSQRMMVNNRLKAIGELFKCYPIHTVAVEDVKFNHRDHRWGKNFSTVEIGKKIIYSFIKSNALLQLYRGFDTRCFRDMYNYKKSYTKNAEVFTAHCSDALALAVDSYAKKHIPPGTFIIVDDTYRPVKRKLHDTQPAKCGIRAKYSTGNFNSIRKGTTCEHGQIVGGTKKSFFIRNQENKRIGRTNLFWLSHHFKTNSGGIGNSSPQQDCGVSLPNEL